MKLYHSAHVSALTRAAAVIAATSVTRTIGPEGGDLVHREAGIGIRFPAGALTRPTTVTLTPDASVLGFTVSPHLTLAKRAEVQIILEPGQADEDLALAAVSTVAATATAHGFFKARIKRLPAARIAQAFVTHFSGYLLASGFNAGQACDPEVVTDGSCVWVDDGEGPEKPTLTEGVERSESAADCSCVPALCKEAPLGCLLLCECLPSTT